MNNNTSPKETNYVHGYPKPQLSPAARNNHSHVHFGNEASGVVFLVAS